MKPNKGKGLVKTKDGHARFYACKRARNLWSDPVVPEMDKNYRVRFSVFGESWVERAKLYPVAAGLTEEAKEWARLKIAARAHLVRTGEKDKLRDIFEPMKPVMLDELARVYLANVPPGKLDYRKNLQRLASIMEEVSGLDMGRIVVSEEWLNRRHLLGWVKMRQEFYRRGWSVRGEMPADAWDVLRADLKAGKLPGIDKTTVSPGNTTIQSYLRCAKAVLGGTARGEYLAGLKLQELREFAEFSVSLAAPQGHREIPADVYARIWRDADALRVADAKCWCFFMLLAYAGLRPITLRGLRDDALTLNADGSAVLAVPSTKRGKPVKRLLPADVVAVLQEVAIPGSLIGAASGTEARKIYLRCNAWLTSCGVEDQQKSYLLRHMNAQLLENEGGAAMVMAGLGHTTEAMGKRYAENRKVIPMVDPRPMAAAG